MAALQEEGGLPWLASPLLPAGGGEQAPGQHQGHSGEADQAVLPDGSLSGDLSCDYFATLVFFLVIKVAFFGHLIIL